ncbi:hypothetical protein FQR65_LT08152 [Abscondita terminalis]|nr:hypothetical protein FQR65_LT08152 [Abscondita terminalis]
MSARVFKPIAFVEIPKIRSTPNVGTNFVYKRFTKVRRSLFNPDPDEMRRFLDEELAKIANDQCDKWGFDFITCKPKENKIYDWSPVVQTNTQVVSSERPNKNRILENDAHNAFLYPPIESSSLTTLEDEMLPELTFTDTESQSSIPKKQSLITAGKLRGQRAPSASSNNLTDLVKPNNPTSSTVTLNRKMKAPRAQDKTDALMLKISEKLQSLQEDSFDVVGRNVADKIRAAAGTHVTFGMKLIGDVLFEAEMVSLIDLVGKNSVQRFSQPQEAQQEHDSHINTVGKRQQYSSNAGSYM